MFFYYLGSRLFDKFRCIDGVNLAIGKRTTSWEETACGNGSFGEFNILAKRAGVDVFVSALANDY